MAWLLTVLVGLATVQATAQVCAPPSSLVTAPASGVVNNYYRGNGNLLVGNSSLVLGAAGPGLTTAIAVGDLLMPIQMQEASINTSNDSSYGDGTGSGAGSTSVGASGRYEFLRVTSVAGANIGFIPPLSNAYTQADATAGTPQKRYQVLRVQQYSTLNATGIETPRWDGLTGGVVAVDVRGALTLAGGAVEGVAGRAFFVAGKGFRGGAGRGLLGNGSSRDDYATPAVNDYHAAKGEGIAGSPYYPAGLTSNWGFRLTNPPAIAAAAAVVPGYPGGSSARGAPANGGGGGTDGRLAPGNANDENAGGGGGGNYGQGGIGGRPWNSPLYDTGGRSGAGYAGTLAFNRVFLGGGGGAGGSNNSTGDAAVYTNQGISCALAAGLCSSGAPGGGIVIIRARSIAGAGVIDARGGHGYNVGNDAAGGGGAGGSIVVQTTSGGNATLDLTGGDGGNAFAAGVGGAPGRHGPGGAGGGGFVAYSPSTGLSIAASVGGGAPGKTMSDITPEENYGSTGYNGGFSAFQAPNVPGVPQAALCDPDLSLVKSNGVTTLISPSTTTYTFTITNAAIGASFGTVSVADKLATGLSVTPGPLALGGANAANWSCSALNGTDIGCTSAAGIAGGGTSTFSIAVAVLSANGTSLTNRGRVGGGGDPNKALPATPAAAVADAAACTANNTPAGCALDTDTVLAPNLVLTKTNGTDTVVRGATTTYSLVVSNTGGTVTTGVFRIFDALPAGMSYSGISPFTVDGFVCTVIAPNVICDRATALAASTSATVTFSVSIDANAPSSLLNRARAGGGGDPGASKAALPDATSTGTCLAPVLPATTASDPNTGCASDAEQVLYVSLQLGKDDGQAFASVGGSTDYVFVVGNIGTAPTAGTINFRDVLPGSMTMSGALATPFAPPGVNGANWSCTRISSTNISCASGVSIPSGGSSSFFLPVNVGADVAGTQQRNKARVGGGGDVQAGMIASPAVLDVTNCISNGNPPGCAIDLNTLQTTPEIRMTKTHPNPQARGTGDAFAFTLTLRNNGGTAAAVNTVRMVDVVPAGLTIGVVTPAAPFTCVTAGQAITCDNTAGALAATSTAIVTVNVTVAAAATNPLVNRARIGGTGDPQNSVLPTSVTAVLCTGTDVPSFGCAADTVPLNADLQITKQQRPGTAGAFQTAVLGVPLGTTVQYQMDITNNGPTNVTGLSFADTIPGNFSTVTWSCAVAAGTASCGTVTAGTGNTISLLTGNMNSTSTLRVTVIAVAGFATTMQGVTNTGSIGVPASVNDSLPGNNTASVLTVIAITNLSITKTNGVGTVTSGGTTSYVLMVSNTGNVPADGTRLFDPVATGLSCTAPPVCVASGPATSCPAGLTMAALQNPTAPAGVAIPTLGGGGTVTITVACGITASGF